MGSTQEFRKRVKIIPHLCERKIPHLRERNI